MKQYLKRSLALLMALVICVGLLPAIRIVAAENDVQYVYGSNNYIYNWGTRGEDATFLSPNAEAFYTGNNTYDVLSAYAGGTGVSNAASSQLYDELQDLMVSNHKKQTSYDETRTMYQYTDCQNSAKDTTAISCFYTGKDLGPAWDGGSTWNREHTWPNSKGLAGNDENDIMMLRPTSSSVNSSRGNKAYGESSGYYNPNSASSNKYDLRGDVARIFLYIYVRWGNVNGNSEYGTVWGTQGVIESVEILLKWMEEDPVDTWELGRNDSVQSITGTRNVFVDYPEFAFILFGEDVPSMQTPSGEAGGSAACSHNYVAGTVVPATCTSTGYTLYTCTLCGATKQENVTAVIAHNYVDGTCSACGATQSNPGTGNATSATISFADTANRTEFSTSKQVWQQNGITVTNDKANSTNNVADYSNPVRFYKGSTVTVAYPGITQLDYICNSASYAETFASGVTGATVTTDGSVVSVVLSEACDSFTVTLSGGQVRMDSITVYAQGVTEEECQHINTVQEGAQAATCTQAGATGKTVCADCGEVLAESTVIPATGHKYVNGTCSVCGATQSTPGTGVETSATISFADTANRTEFDTSKQVWQQNGITVTNNKSGSSSNIADYANPARFYKGSTLTVAYPGMTKLVVTCNTSAYATAFASAVTDGEVTTSGSAVTIVLSDACDSYTVTLTGGQVRVNEITVYAGAAEEHTHTPGEAVKENVTNLSYDSVIYCTGCGDELERQTILLVEEDFNAKFAQTGLSLGEFIGLQSAIMKSALNSGDYEQAYFSYKQYSYDDNGALVQIDNGTGEFLDMGSYLVADCLVNAKQMGDVFEISARYIKDGITYYGPATTTSVKAEAMKKVNATGTDDKTLKTKALCIAMLNYGAEAQKTFKYSTAVLANSELADTDKHLTAFEDLALVKSNTIPTTPIKPASAGLSLGEVVYMQFLIKMSDVDAKGTLKYQIPGEDAVEIAASELETYQDTYYLVNIPIKAKYVRTDITINLSAENYTMVCSIEAFAVAKEASSTEALVCALMDYGDAAKALFG